ncbi:MAG: ISAzo13 family transposase [Planctomycetota bacterium]
MGYQPVARRRRWPQFGGKKTPEIIEAIAAIMEHETAGDPVSGCKWTRKTTAKIAQQLKRIRIRVSAKTVGRLLKQMKFSLRMNLKSLESGLRNPPDPRQRDQQFRYIQNQIRTYSAQGLPVISVDTKSRELIGAFHQSGRRWSQEPIEVFDHDFPSDSKGIALPYGIYDISRNEGFVCVGTSRDTSQFAVDSIRMWWLKAGSSHYPDADRLLILADCGGSNGYRTRLWKQQLQVTFCNHFSLEVKVCHYPPGSSKWNPIEHRMFSFISSNWVGQPLLNYETVLKFIRTTKTSAGLKIRAILNKKQYLKGIKISDRQMKDIALKRFTLRPNWNYSICPTKM